HLDVAGRDRPCLTLLDAQDRLVDALVHRQRERLEVPDDLVHVLDDAADGLMFVQHAVDAEGPHGRPAQRRQQHAAHGVPQRVAEPALQRLEPELGDVGVVLALGGFYQLRANEPAEIDGLWHGILSCPAGMLPATPHPAPNARWAREGVRVPDLNAGIEEWGFGIGRCGAQSNPRSPIANPRWLLRIQLDDQLLLSGDRNVVPARTLEDPAAVGVAI